MYTPPCGQLRQKIFVRGSDYQSLLREVLREEEMPAGCGGLDTTPPSESPIEKHITAWIAAASVANAAAAGSGAAAAAGVAAKTAAAAVTKAAVAAGAATEASAGGGLGEEDKHGVHQEWQGLRWHGGSSEIKVSINGSAPMGGQLTNDEDSDGDGGGEVQLKRAGRAKAKAEAARVAEWEEEEKKSGGGEGGAGG